MLLSADHSFRLAYAKTLISPVWTCDFHISDIKESTSNTKSDEKSKKPDTEIMLKAVLSFPILLHILVTIHLISLSSSY